MSGVSLLFFSKPDFLRLTDHLVFLKFFLQKWIPVILRRIESFLNRSW